MDKSLASLRLSALELESIVDGVGSASGVGLGFLNSYPLVGGVKFLTVGVAILAVGGFA